MSPTSTIVHVVFFFFNDTATTEIYTLSLHDALPIWRRAGADRAGLDFRRVPHQPVAEDRKSTRLNSSHDQISYAVFCLKKKNNRCEPAPLTDEPESLRAAVAAPVSEPIPLVRRILDSRGPGTLAPDLVLYFFFNDTATPEIYTLSLHDALPISRDRRHPRPDRVRPHPPRRRRPLPPEDRKSTRLNSSHDQISYAVFCLKKK